MVHLVPYLIPYIIFLQGVWTIAHIETIGESWEPHLRDFKVKLLGFRAETLRALGLRFSVTLNSRSKALSLSTVGTSAAGGWSLTAVTLPNAVDVPWKSVPRLTLQFPKLEGPLYRP